MKSTWPDLARYASLHDHLPENFWSLMQVNILEAKNRLSELIRAVRRGKEVVIANRGEPVARLLPPADPLATSERNLVRWLKEHPLPPHARRRAEEIDASIAAERAAWD